MSRHLMGLSPLIRFPTQRPWGETWRSSQNGSGATWPSTARMLLPTGRLPTATPRILPDPGCQSEIFVTPQLEPERIFQIGSQELVPCSQSLVRNGPLPLQEEFAAHLAQEGANGKGRHRNDRGA